MKSMRSTVVALMLVLVAVPALANHFYSYDFTADCYGFEFTINGKTIDPFLFDYSITVYNENLGLLNDFVVVEDLYVEEWGSGEKTITGTWNLPCGDNSIIGSFFMETMPGAQDPATYGGDIVFDVFDCLCSSAGTGTPGYWKNHPDAWCDLNGDATGVIDVGGISYTVEAAIEVMNSTGQKGPKDKTYDLFKHLVAAKLNIGCNGTSGICVGALIDAADEWLADHSVGSGVRANSGALKDDYYDDLSIKDIFGMLDQYNIGALYVDGELCAPSRDYLEEQEEGAAKPALSFPTEFSIDQNFPNPFNPVTTIGFTLPQASPVVLTVYNTVGERVATLVDGVYPAGSYAVEWDAREYASGIYIYRIQAGSYTATNKMMLLK